jgi:DNA-binding IclR family transcriptional regulator
MDDTSNAARRIKASETAFSVLDTIYRKGGTTVTDIADELDMAYSTVHDHVTTLESLMFVHEVDGDYHIGLRFLNYGIHAKEKHKVTRVAPPKLEELAEETSEAVWLFVAEHDSIVGIHKEGSDIVSSGEWLGKHMPFHCTAGGKAILACYDDDRIDELLSRHSLKEITSNTITDREAFRTEIETIRQRGYALNRGEAIRNVRGVARAIRVNDNVLGSVVVVGPSHRLNGDRFREVIPEKLRETVGDIEINMMDFMDTTPFAFED